MAFKLAMYWETLGPLPYADMMAGGSRCETDARDGGDADGVIARRVRRSNAVMRDPRPGGQDVRLCRAQ